MDVKEKAFELVIVIIGKLVDLLAYVVHSL